MGWVIVPTTGAVGVTGCALIVTCDDEGDVTAEALVTVNVYVPGANDVIVLLVTEPVTEIFPGVIPSDQFPDGSPLIVTLPVVTVQLGCVIAPTTGAVGVVG